MKFITSVSLLVAALGLVNAAPSTLVAHASAPTHTGQGMSFYDQRFEGRANSCPLLASFTDFGLGSCGTNNNDSEMVVGVSTAFFNGFP
jgi:hypothetical protein